MKGQNENDHIFLHYIDGNIDGAEAEILKDILASDPACKDELFESKDIADMIRFGNMEVREQERMMLELQARMEASDRKRRRCRVFRQLMTYAAIVCVAFLAGAMTLHLMSTQEGTIVVRSAPGNKSDVVLPDGTRITLKSSSVLEYDISAFDSGERIVRLDGEAFFDVAPDPDSKFIVKCDRQDVVVHGTVFNLRAFNTDPYSILTLLEGKVTTTMYSDSSEEKRSVDMNSMERCICDMETGRIILKRVDPSELDHKWDENICYFKNKSLRHIAERLQLYYDAEILIDESVNDKDRFTGAVSLSCPVTDVLKLINYDHKYTILKTGDRNYTINNNNNN